MTISIATVFGAGLLTFFTPCVLPLVPIYLAALSGGSLSSDDQSRGRLLLRAALFSLGFILVFTAMGFGASAVSAFLSDHKSVVQGIGAVIVLVFALKFLGLLRIPAMDRIVKADDRWLKTRFGSVNALIMGIVFAAGWSPCVGPVLGSVLTYTASTTADPVTGAIYLSIYGLGFALPLLITALFAEVGLRLIRRINAYLPRIEKAVGAALVLIAGMLLLDVAEAHLGAPADPRADLSDPTEEAAPLGIDVPVMVALYSADCPVCRQMKPVVDGVRTECNDKGVQIRAVDVSEPENRHLIQEHRVIGVPTFVFLDEAGTEVTRLVGEQTEAALKQAISVLRGEPCPGVAVLGDEFSNPTSPGRAEGCRI